METPFSLFWFQRSKTLCMTTSANIKVPLSPFEFSKSNLTGNNMRMTCKSVEQDHRTGPSSQPCITMVMMERHHGKVNEGYLLPLLCHF